MEERVFKMSIAGLIGVVIFLVMLLVITHFVVKHDYEEFHEDLTKAIETIDVSQEKSSIKKKSSSKNGSFYFQVFGENQELEVPEKIYDRFDVMDKIEYCKYSIDIPLPPNYIHEKSDNAQKTKNEVVISYDAKDTQDILEFTSLQSNVAEKAFAKNRDALYQSYISIYILCGIAIIFFASLAYESYWYF